jgi:predicted nucleotidyltransferase
MTAILGQELERLCSVHGLVAIYVFGSRAEEIAARVTGGRATPERPGSDVDIGVQPVRGRRLPASERVDLMQALEALFDVRRVDLIVLSEADAFLAADVVRGELLAMTDPDAEAEAQLYYLRRAADLAPFLREAWSDRVGNAL